MQTHTKTQTIDTSILPMPSETSWIWATLQAVMSAVQSVHVQEHVSAA